VLEEGGRQTDNLLAARNKATPLDRDPVGAVVSTGDLALDRTGRVGVLTKVHRH
jgi:hypothetical protein